MRNMDTNEKSKFPCRRSQRLRKLKKTHCLFQEPQVMTPVNRQGVVILAYETPDQELLTAVERKHSSTKRGIWWEAYHYYKHFSSMNNTQKLIWIKAENTSKFSPNAQVLFFSHVNGI